MFHFKTVKTQETCLKYFVRYVRGRRTADPGIQRRKTLLERDASSKENVDFDDLESDFHNLGISHREHLREMDAMREREKLSIVKQKYFKEKYSNFLTWADKQQIKLLHGKDPEQWSIDKLSESFPALPEIIKKIVKSNWTKTSASKIQAHDITVSNNWKSFKNGKIELSPNLSEHLSKFTTRELNLNPILEDIQKPNLKLQEGEFSDIITSYEKLKKKPESAAASDKIINVKNKQKPPLKENYLLSEVTDINQQLTLREYKRELEAKDDLSLVDQEIITNVPSANTKEQVDDLVETEEIKLDVVKYVNNTGQISSYNSKTDYSHLTYPEKIVIPTDKRKRGCTYKLNDCYYDDDGLFLYRVPGMN